MKSKLFAVGLICIIVGLTAFLIGYQTTGGDFGSANGTFGPFRIRFGAPKDPVSSEEKTLQYINSEITSIDLNDDNADVRLLSSEDSSWHLIYQESDEDPVEVSVQNGVLTFDRKDTANILGFWSAPYERVTTLYLPKGSRLTKLSVSTDNGELQCSLANLPDPDEVHLSTDNGRISVEVLTAGRCTVESDNGEILLKNIHVPDLRIKTDNGRLSLSGVTAEALTAKSNNGAIELTDVKADTISAETDRGAILLDKAAPTREIRLETDTGAIHGTLCGTIDMYTIRSSVDVGRNTLPTERIAGSILLTAEVDVGDIDLSFLGSGASFA